VSAAQGKQEGHAVALEDFGHDLAAVAVRVHRRAGMHAHPPVPESGNCIDITHDSGYSR
jgi:hypothetical protein